MFDTALARREDVTEVALAAVGYYDSVLHDVAVQRAVDQVVLNRLRHPAFPKTVCGVVFQGSERATGCQFTFTCDGAMTRTPSDAAWKRAREVAGAALTGKVDKTVGWATHYHTDWVVPYWSASLDKVARQGTHLFFRWTGWWGTASAFNRRPTMSESPVAQLARLSPAHQMAGALAEAGAALVEAVPFFGRTPAPLPGDPNTFLTSLNPAQAANYQAMAKAACGARARCRVMGWTDTQTMGFVLPLSIDQMAGMSFSYIRDNRSGLDRTLWNCTEFPGRSPCMKRQTLRLVKPAVAPIPVGDTVTTQRGPAELEGVRRKPLPAPTAAPPPVEAEVMPPGTSPPATP